MRDGSHEALYDRPVATYWDVQAGVRYDLHSASSRGWAAFGIEATQYVSDGGHAAGRFRSFYDSIITQRLVLEPEIELNSYTINRRDPARGIGAGLADLDASLHLRYEISRKFAPYLGVSYDKYGTTADYARRKSESLNNLRLALGVRAWF